MKKCTAIGLIFLANYCVGMNDPFRQIGRQGYIVTTLEKSCGTEEVIASLQTLKNSSEDDFENNFKDLVQKIENFESKYNEERTQRPFTQNPEEWEQLNSRKLQIEMEVFSFYMNNMQKILSMRSLEHSLALLKQLRIIPQ